jgi:Carboxypeptidase regulatory-like domain
MRFILTLVLVLMLALSSLGRGSSTIQGGYGTFRGVIVDSKGKRIRGASVTISGPDLSREVKPNRDGYFEIVLPAGKYEITVKKAGFAKYMLTDLEVGRNQELSHVFRLESSRVQSAFVA